MLISIITPVYNSGENIAANVNSIITQSYRNYNHIIIDNLSTDNSISIIKDLYEKSGITDKLKIVGEKDNGISDAFNKGIKAAEGEIVGILNSDDYYYDDTVFERVHQLFRDERTLFVHGNILFIDPVYGSNIRKPLLCPLTTAMPYNHPAMFFRKSVYDKYGFYNLSFRYAMDFEFICKLESQITNFRERGVYINGNPLTIMRAGGTSWRNEAESVKEVGLALKIHGLWNNKARFSYAVRSCRILLKKYLHFFRLDIITKKWRNIKWGKGNI